RSGRVSLRARGVAHAAPLALVSVELGARRRLRQEFTDSSRHARGVRLQLATVRRWLASGVRSLFLTTSASKELPPMSCPLFVPCLVLVAPLAASTSARPAQQSAANATNPTESGVLHSGPSFVSSPVPSCSSATLTSASN